MRTEPTSPQLLNQVFAAFGEAVFDAGLFEVELRTLLLMTQLLTLGRASERAAEFDRLSAKTLGGLIAELRKRGIKPDPSTEIIFIDCLKLRNYLIHRFFFEHSLDLPVASRAKPAL